jgi:hypothetical protein
MTVVKIEMTEEQYEKLVDLLSVGCPSRAGLPEKCGAMPGCNECWEAALNPETIPDKGKEG